LSFQVENKGVQARFSWVL